MRSCSMTFFSKTRSLSTFLFSDLSSIEIITGKTLKECVKDCTLFQARYLDTYFKNSTQINSLVSSLKTEKLYDNDVKKYLIRSALRFIRRYHPNTYKELRSKWLDEATCLSQTACSQLAQLAIFGDYKQGEFKLDPAVLETFTLDALTLKGMSFTAFQKGLSLHDAYNPALNEHLCHRYD